MARMPPRVRPYTEIIELRGPAGPRNSGHNQIIPITCPGNKQRPFPMSPGEDRDRAAGENLGRRIGIRFREHPNTMSARSCGDRRWKGSCDRCLTAKPGEKCRLTAVQYELFRPGSTHQASCRQHFHINCSEDAAFQGSANSVH